MQTLDSSYVTEHDVVTLCATFSRIYSKCSEGLVYLE